MPRPQLEALYAFIMNMLALAEPGSAEHRYLANLLRRVEDALSDGRGKRRLPPAP